MIVNIDSIKLLCFMRIENTKDFNTKEELKRKYEGRNHKKDFNM